MTVYNGEKFVAEAVESVLKQILPSDEIIVINDGSTDNTLEILSQYPELKVISQENKGIAYSRNKAIELATGKYLTFIDADDLWHPNKSYQQFSYLEQNPAIDIVFSHLEHFVKSSFPSSMQVFKPQKGMMQLCAMIEKQKFLSIGQFSGNLGGEFILWFQKAKLYGLQDECLSEVLAYRRLHANNFTRRTEYTHNLTRLAKQLIEQRMNFKRL